MLLNDTEGLLKAYPELPIPEDFESVVKPILLTSDWVIDVEIKSSTRVHWVGLWGMFAGQFGITSPGCTLEFVLASIAADKNSKMYITPVSSLGPAAHTNLINFGFVSKVEFDNEYLVWSKR